MTRTRDLLITNQLLYQLSYAGQAGTAILTLQAPVLLDGARMRGTSTRQRFFAPVSGRGSPTKPSRFGIFTFGSVV